LTRDVFGKPSAPGTQTEVMGAKSEYDFSEQNFSRNIH